jgi:hypothetical protein
LARANEGKRAWVAHGPREAAFSLESRRVAL